MTGNLPFSGTAPILEFVALRIVDIHPHSGPVLGNTTVTLIGYGFQLGALSCRFAQSILVPASRLSAHRLRCNAPPYPTSGWASLEVQSYFGIAESASAFYYQSFVSHFAALGSSLLNQGMPDSASRSTVILGPRDVLAPALGPVNGGTIIGITGTGFLNVEPLSCRFGNAQFTVFARYLSAKTIECVAPAHRSGLVNVEISTNGQQFTSINARFLYHETLIIQGDRKSVV